MNKTLRALSQNMKLFSDLGKTGARLAGEDAYSDAFDKKRTQRLIDALARTKPKVDFLCLQEVFDEDRRWQLKKALKKQGYWVTGKFGDDIREDSGLFMASRHPMGSVVGRIFTFVEGAGSDRLAAKGVLAYMVSVDPKKYGIDQLWLGNTHLQAYSSAESRRARKQQFKHVRAVVGNPIAKGVPALMLGDFNVDEESTEYPTMLRALGNPTDLLRVVKPSMVDHPEYTWNAARNTLASGAPERLDYVFGYSRGDHLMNVVSSGIQLFGTKRGTRLSDHLGIEARVRFWPEE